MDWYVQVLKKYAVFSGRARRKEYWMFLLVSSIILLVLTLVGGKENAILGIYELAVMIPTMAVGVRRLHDTDRSGWWLICPLVNLLFLVGKGTDGDNRFGPDPKGATVA